MWIQRRFSSNFFYISNSNSWFLNALRNNCCTLFGLNKQKSSLVSAIQQAWMKGSQLEFPNINLFIQINFLQSFIFTKPNTFYSTERWFCYSIFHFIELSIHLGCFYFFYTSKFDSFDRIILVQGFSRFRCNFTWICTIKFSWVIWSHGFGTYFCLLMGPFLGNIHVSFSNYLGFYKSYVFYVNHHFSISKPFCKIKLRCKHRDMTCTRDPRFP